MRAAAWLPAAVLSCVLSACTHAEPATQSPGSTTQSAPPDSAAAARLHGTLTQYRLDEGTRNVNAQITNTGAQTVAVTSVVLRSRGFTPVPPTPKDTIFAPGQTIDLQTTYGDPLCRTRAPGPARVVLGMQGGPDVTVRLDRPGQAFLDRLYTRECGLAEIADVASISFGANFSRVRVAGEPYLHGVLVVDRSADPKTRHVRLTVESLAGSVLLTLLPQRGVEALPATLTPETATVRIPILIGSSNRCDPHARGQSTQTFLLSVFAHIGDSSTQRIILVPDKQTQRQALAVIEAACRSAEN